MCFFFTFHMFTITVCLHNTHRVLRNVLVRNICTTQTINMQMYVMKEKNANKTLILITIGWRPWNYFPHERLFSSLIYLLFVYSMNHCNKCNLIGKFKLMICEIYCNKIRRIKTGLSESVISSFLSLKRNSINSL